MAEISSHVDLSDPLGQPKIVTGTEYMDALARLGYNRENMFSPLPMITKGIQSLTSLVDENYNNQMKWQASQAQIKETLARAGNIDSQTAYNNQALDLRLKDLDLQNKERQQNLDFATEAHPTVKRMLENKGKQSDLDIQRAERSSKDEADSLDLLPQATAELPDPDDPDYVNKRDLWRIKYNRLLTNPTTKNRMEGEYQAIDSIYQGRISTQQTNSERKEFSDLQTGGFIPKVLNPDAAMRGPDKDSFLTRGRMLQARQQVEMVAAQLPDGDPYKDKLQTILNEADTHTKSDTGVQDIMAGKSSIFDTNGHLTGTSLAAAQQAQTHLTQLGVVPKPETEVKVPFGQPSQKGEYPGVITFKGLTPEKAEEKARQFGLTEPAKPPEGTPEQRFLQNIQDPQIRALGERLARKEITYQQFVDELKKIPPPSPTSGKTEGTIEAPSTTQTGRPGTEDRLATSNNDYAFPSGAPDVMGIDRNVWANVMSEEGREFGKDGSHDSVFGLWADAPGVESAAYRAVRQHGPDSLQAYNVVTRAWTQAFLSQSRPWDLNSPGLQEMVIADSQHRGGAAARAIINQMGGYTAVNSMDPADAIRTYSELRKPLWPGNNRPFADGASDRVTREMHWALTHDRQLASTQEQLGGPQASAIAPQEGNRRMVPEGSAIRPVSYQPGVEGGLGEDQRYGLQSQNAPRPRLVTTDPTTVDFGDYSFDVAGTFGRHDDGTIDKSESGKGFYTNPATGKPYDVRDSKLVGARIPITDLEQVIGLGAADRKSVTSSEIARGEYQVLVATPDGTVVQMPIVDVNTDQNARGLELTYGASKLFQTRGARQLGYKIVNRNGETITPTYGVKPSEIKGRQTYISPV